jgi:hypothetical protein
MYILNTGVYKVKRKDKNILTLEDEKSPVI